MDKIQELTSKIYSEGVEKGRAEADKIIAEAKSSANKIVENAHHEAEKVTVSAKKEMEELKKNTEAELKLFASQSVEALKTEITNMVSDKLAKANVESAFNDKTFFNNLILELVRNWSKEEQLTIGVESSKDLEKFIASNTSNLLDKGLKIEQVNGLKTSFTVAPADGSYKVVFGKQEFIEYFKEFLRPQIQKLLFM